MLRDGGRVRLRSQALRNFAHTGKSRAYSGDREKLAGCDRDRRRLFLPHAGAPLLPGATRDASCRGAQREYRDRVDLTARQVRCASVVRPLDGCARLRLREGKLPMMRLGITIPQEPFQNPQIAELARTAERCGYTDAWSYESFGADAFNPIAAA